MRDDGARVIDVRSAMLKALMTSSESAHRQLGLAEQNLTVAADLVRIVTVNLPDGEHRDLLGSAFFLLTGEEVGR